MGKEKSTVMPPIKMPISMLPIAPTISPIVITPIEIVPIEIVPIEATPTATIMPVVIEKKPAYKFGDKNPVVVKPIDESAPIIIPVVRPTQPINNKQPPVEQPPAKTVVEEQTEIIPSTAMKQAEPLTKTKDIKTSTSSDSSTTDNTPLIVGGAILSILILISFKNR